MISVMATILSVGLAWVIVGSFYWKVFHPVLRKRILFRLYAGRDSLRRLAVGNKDMPSSFAYKFAEQNICALANNLNALTFYAFHKFKAEQSSVKDFPEIQKFYREAPNEVRIIWKEAAATASNMLLINSPTLVLFFWWVVLPISAIRKGMKVLMATDDQLQAFVATGIPSAA